MKNIRGTTSGLDEAWIKRLRSRAREREAMENCKRELADERR